RRIGGDGRGDGQARMAINGEVQLAVVGGTKEEDRRLDESEVVGSGLEGADAVPAAQDSRRRVCAVWVGQYVGGADAVTDQALDVDDGAGHRALRAGHH